MAINVPRGNCDEVVNTIKSLLRKYEKDHPKAKIDVYRQDPFSVRIRIVDPDFARQEKSERHRLVWSYLDRLPDEAQSDISMLLLLTPREKKMSFANMEFDDPVPSKL